MKNKREDAWRQKKTTQNLISAIREGDIWAAEYIVKDQLKQMRDRKDGEIDFCRENLFFVLGQMSFALNDADLIISQKDDIIRDTCHLLCSEVVSPEEYEKIMEETVRRLCGLIREKKNGWNSPLVRQVILEAEENLRKPLTLSYFAERLNVNRSYLSSLFKKETGISLTDYITQRRMTVAASLLVTTDYPIRDVAELTGIRDVHYFSRLFHLKMGVTPGQYRKNTE